MISHTNSLAVSFVFTLLIGPALTAQRANAQDASFEPVRIEREAELSLEGSPDEVFYLFSPEGRRQLASAAVLQEELVFSGRRGTPVGAMIRVTHPELGPGESWDVVTDYDPETRTMRLVHLEGNVELLMEEVHVVPGAHGGSIAKINWRVVGLSEAGNRAVQRFMDNHFDEQASSLEAEINAFLREQAG